MTKLKDPFKLNELYPQKNNNNFPALVLMFDRGKCVLERRVCNISLTLCEHDVS